MGSLMIDGQHFALPQELHGMYRGAATLSAQSRVGEMCIADAETHFGHRLMQLILSRIGCLQLEQTPIETIVQDSIRDILCTMRGTNTNA